MTGRVTVYSMRLKTAPGEETPYRLHPSIVCRSFFVGYIITSVFKQPFQILAAFC